MMFLFHDVLLLSSNREHIPQTEVCSTQRRKELQAVQQQRKDEGSEALARTSARAAAAEEEFRRGLPTLFAMLTPGMTERYLQIYINGLLACVTSM